MKSHVFAEASSQTIRIQDRIHPDPKLACLLKCSVLCSKIQDSWPDPNPDPAGSREADLGNIVYCGMKSKSQGRIHPHPKLVCFMGCSVLCCKIQDPWPDPNPDPAGSREADLGNVVYCGMKSTSQGRIHPDPKLVCFMKCSILSENSFILFPIP